MELMPKLMTDNENTNHYLHHALGNKGICRIYNDVLLLSRKNGIDQA
jgi:hypothetical protein